MQFNALVSALVMNVRVVHTPECDAYLHEAQQHTYIFRDIHQRGHELTSSESGSSGFHSISFSRIKTSVSVLLYVASNLLSWHHNG